MNALSLILVGLVAALHLGFLVLEMFLWTTPTGRGVFGTDREFAGLVWGLVADDNPVQLFFLACVVVAGVFGAATVSRRILWVQALPAALAAGLVLASR